MQCLSQIKQYIGWNGRKLKNKNNTHVQTKIKSVKWQIPLFRFTQLSHSIFKKEIWYPKNLSPNAWISRENWWQNSLSVLLLDQCGEFEGRRQSAVAQLVTRPDQIKLSIGYPIASVRVMGAGTLSLYIGLWRLGGMSLPVHSVFSHVMKKLSITQLYKTRQFFNEYLVIFVVDQLHQDGIWKRFRLLVLSKDKKLDLHNWLVFTNQDRYLANPASFRYSFSFTLHGIR